jgi:thiamine kinase-like enzyme
MVQLTEKIKSIPGELALEQSLSSGAISQVFLCTFNNTKAVIRIDCSAASMLSIDRSSEVKILNRVKHLELAPEVLYQNKSNGILIWEFIPGEHPLFNPDKKDYCLQSLGRELSLIHNTPIPSNCSDVFSNAMDLYGNLLKKTSYELMYKKAVSLFKDLCCDDRKKVLSHNDLNPGNLLWNKKFYFLDWEYAGLNHPCFDIASLVYAYKLDPAQVHELSIGYGGDQELFVIERLNDWIEFIHSLNEIWKISVNVILEELPAESD